MMTEKEISIFCKNIKYLREKHNLEKREMADICGIDIPSLEKIEKGILPDSISIDIVINLYRHFNISPEKFFAPLDK